ncbi:sodium:proton antiporter [Mesorhizobium sp. M2D.F.Ca.ET.185.01.1.1]|uniref:cation:proton antiporter n=1 Tax=unclassified Mesorhizobium TaxID=325217 RepID=UPI000FCC125D|nr:MULTISPECIES: sodium:proton antiporter [unclassified Mesorhizobium]TGP82702.1 sodium:proton antiporter [bacterium M00.F.Ca.ET.227.01.1.1]TGP94456.1 sodium:proton antiporter [bacterium M00.F.Ca.ET.221.01.1.1]TGP97909.1 sodium:proton antiporter [bacterium M00.F.Ca.ET.222.01.1.1]TGT74992.1 sodium:proton antiporter [bacterium M00.F.Ca.ET.159.01.1.1]TGT87859.1 sodium:proton antiporter [bacterium M00.F.Ca.ET.157.01.1.1]TGU11779.1 sodium:proton antiporter [bacterium M00.F.Ca.ET.163.01.1.1]TGU359
MALFELTLVLLLIAVALTALSRRLEIPYPSLLALAGVGIAFVPGAPTIEIDPELALALFIAPVLLDAAFDTSLRDLQRYRLSLILLALGAVVFTAVVVAFVGWTMGGLPIAAAIALGAIVAPPDAVAASAVLNQFKVPHRITAILQGESLLNDATALLIYRISVAAAIGSLVWREAVPVILLATIGSVFAGYVFGRLSLITFSRIEDAASSTVVQFAGTFAVWIIADKLGLSAIITIVVYAITLARGGPRRMSPRRRVSTYSVWESAVFVLNVLAFVLMGLQARSIIGRLSGDGQGEAFLFAATVLAVVIVARLVWVAGYVAVIRWFARVDIGDQPLDAPTFRGAVLVGWCGMRGLVTLVAAVALPVGFPGRDPIVLAAFAVVLGTLVLQGMTLKPLLRRLNFPRDTTVDREVALARVAVMEAALDVLSRKTSAAAAVVREQYEAQRRIAEDPEHAQAATEYDRLRLYAIKRQRDTLEELRSNGTIGDEAYHRLEEEIDWAELAAAPAGTFQPLTTY